MNGSICKSAPALGLISIKKLLHENLPLIRIFLQPYDHLSIAIGDVDPPGRLMFHTTCIPTLTYREYRAMNLMRFIGLLFVFIGVLASCVVTISLLVLMLRFWPLLLAVVLALAMLQKLIHWAGIRISAST
ncbi:TPA: hypothetical protein ACRNCN_002639 [Pseudomonas aeruginosa]|uniref:hypothetical protein n=1 Tax=Pseudomonas aeruginosa TaxID=287 RepID=UPI003E124AED